MRNFLAIFMELGKNFTSMAVFTFSFGTFLVKSFVASYAFTELLVDCRMSFGAYINSLSNVNYYE